MLTRSVLITGASTGIGEACALHLDRLGWRVYAGVRTEADGARLAAATSGRLRPLLLDVLDPAQIAAAAERIGDETGEEGLHALVNNAGIAVSGPLEYVPIADVRRQLEVNVTGQIAVTQACLPLLRRASHARIVFMGSIAGISTSPLVGAYCASKHALEAVADAYRIELAPWELEVSIVEPGVVFTPIWGKGTDDSAALVDAMPPEGRERYAPLFTAFRRLITGRNRRGVQPEAVARVVEHALTARRPRTRYLVGRDARIRARLRRLLPDRWHDRLILTVLRRLSAPRPIA